MKKPKFDKLTHLFESYEDFSLTEKQYLQSTGSTLPKNQNYLINSSALSKIAKQYGFKIEIIEKTICLKRK